MDAKPTEDLIFLDHPVNTASAMATLAVPVAAWFRDCFGEPTPIQRLAWPALASGRNLLLSAPTGTGKTLAAFLPILNRLLGEDGSRGAAPSVRCLYVAPLKALANDACRNLGRFIQELVPLLPSPVPWPSLALRTGDTPAGQRQRLHREPPDVLLTTPESLAILLSQPNWQGPFSGLRWVVVDEIHALAATKRGADLALSLERLTQGAVGPIQRIGLSATATPLAEAAQFLCGVDRPCAVARVTHGTPLQLTIEPLEGGHGFLANLVARLEPTLRSGRTTLIFTNTRRLAERLAWTLRRRMPDWDDQVAVHHSAVAASRRQEVEGRLKQGQLRVVVSSTSLELGIDIGAIDQVVLVHPPGDVVRLLQRVGRAGHGPDRVRRALVLTASAAELLEAAVTGASGQADQCEPLAVPAHPLDVLCQQLVGMAGAGPWSSDEVFALVRRAYPYRDLFRGDFNDCLAYLQGLGSDGQAWLPARLRSNGT
jgi:ATP-dependent Lhr-like helicase